MKTKGRNIINNNQDRKLICFIIDEPQKARNMKDVDSFIFSLYQTFLGKAKFCFIFLSQMRYENASRSFAEDTLSRLQLKPMIFTMYDAPQIVSILKQRLDYALKPEAYDTKALYRLANHIRLIGGDMREALDILHQTMKFISKTKVTIDNINEGIEWGKNRWWKNELSSLPSHY